MSRGQTELRLPSQVYFGLINRFSLGEGAQFTLLTYGSEIWGSCMKISRTTPSLDKIYRDMHAEKLHLKYCKYVLGIHSKASNLATVGELGRFPIYNFICESISKFYLHIKGKEPDSLLQQTLQTSKQLQKMVLNLGIVEWILF